jgi:SAM-dependent methyltransferase
MTQLSPWLYGLVGALAAPGAECRIRDVLRHWLGTHPAPGCCLDVGCGTDSWLRLVGRRPVGVDLDARRVAVFARRHGWAVPASATALPFPEGAFDSVWSFGLLHHLSDENVRVAVGEMRRVARAGGCIVVMDGVLPRAAWRRPLAAGLRWLDRGEWMRSQEELEALLAPFGAWERQRLTYALTGLEGVLCTLRAN